MESYKCLNKTKYGKVDRFLVPIREQDIYKIMNWRNAQIDFLRQSERLVVKDQTKYFDEVIKPSFVEMYPKQILFSYIYKNECIGYGGLVHISWPKKDAELSFLLSTKYMQKKCVFEKDFDKFIHLLLNIAFKELNLHTVSTEVYSFRTSAIEVLEENGFKFERIMKDRKLINGKSFDSFIHKITNEKI